MKTNYEKIKEWRKNTKIKLVEGFGKMCSICHLIDDPIVYDFHHLDPDQKDFGIASRIRSWENVISEAKKCVMLCSHCHRKVHFSGLKIETPILFDETKVVSHKNNRW